MTENTAPTEAGPAGPAGPAGLDAPERAPRRLRAEAQRNIGSLLAAAKAVFGTPEVRQHPLYGELRSAPRLTGDTSAARDYCMT